MPTGLYRLIGGQNIGDLTPGIIESFIAQNQLDEETKERLILWENESKYWDSYAKNISIKHRDTYWESPTYKSIVKTIEDLIDPKDNEVWLDPGCGALSMSELIFKKANGVKKIYAMDVFLKPAKERLLNLNSLSNQNISSVIELVYGSLTDSLPFPDNFFDGIVGNFVFTFITEHEGEKGEKGLKNLFQELYRILKPGGVLVWTSPRKNANNLLGLIPSIGYALNPYLWYKSKTFLPLGVINILKHTKALLKKGKDGICPILPREDYEKLLSSIGFVNPKWINTFGNQAEANRIYKPKA